MNTRLDVLRQVYDVVLSIRVDLVGYTVVDMFAMGSSNKTIMQDVTFQSMRELEDACWSEWQRYQEMRGAA